MGKEREPREGEEAKCLDFFSQGILEKLYNPVKLGPQIFGALVF